MTWRQAPKRPAVGAGDDSLLRASSEETCWEQDDSLLRASSEETCWEQDDSLLRASSEETCEVDCGEDG